MGMVPNQPSRFNSNNTQRRGGSAARGGKLSGMSDAIEEPSLKQGREFFGDKGSKEREMLEKLPGILAMLQKQREARLQGVPTLNAGQAAPAQGTGLLQSLMAQGQQQIAAGSSPVSVTGGMGGGSKGGGMMGQENNPTLMKQKY